jgi:hypothetical protein
MVAVAVGDDRTRYAPPGIDVEVAGGAVKTVVVEDDQVGSGSHPATPVVVLARAQASQGGAG